MDQGPLSASSTAAVPASKAAADWLQVSRVFRMSRVCLLVNLRPVNAVRWPLLALLRPCSLFAKLWLCGFGLGLKALDWVIALTSLGDSLDLTGCTGRLPRPH